MADNKSFENALKKLEAAVANLESGDLTLEQSLQVFADGVTQVGVCRKALQEVELQVEQLVQQADGQLPAKDLSDES